MMCRLALNKTLHVDLHVLVTNNDEFAYKKCSTRVECFFGDDRVMLQCGECCYDYALCDRYRDLQGGALMGIYAFDRVE